MSRQRTQSESVSAEEQIINRYGISGSDSREEFIAYTIERWKREIATMKIFVFGSNLAGHHAAGAAAFAVSNHGAIWGNGKGLQGNSYAIPTMHGLEILKESVIEFQAFAEDNRSKQFQVTRIGCGIAGYMDSQIAPLFKDAPANCTLPDEWQEIIQEMRK